MPILCWDPANPQLDKQQRIATDTHQFAQLTMDYGLWLAV